MDVSEAIGESGRSPGYVPHTLSTVTSDRQPRPQGKFMWRMLASVLGGQGLVIFFGALAGRGLDQGQDAVFAGLTPFALMSGLAVLSILAAGLVRRPFGPALGWVVQALTILSGVWVGMMYLVGGLFALLYGYCQVTGRRIDREQAARTLDEQES